MVRGDARLARHASWSRPAKGPNQGSYDHTPRRRRHCILSGARRGLPIAHQRRTQARQRARSNRRLNSDRPQAGGALAGTCGCRKSPAANIDTLRCDMGTCSIDLGVDGQMGRDLLGDRVDRPASQIDRGDQRYRGHFLERSKRPVSVLFLQPR